MIYTTSIFAETTIRDLAGDIYPLVLKMIPSIGEVGIQFNGSFVCWLDLSKEDYENEIIVDNNFTWISSDECIALTARTLKWANNLMDAE